MDDSVCSPSVSTSNSSARRDEPFCFRFHAPLSMTERWSRAYSAAGKENGDGDVVSAEDKSSAFFVADSMSARLFPFLAGMVVDTEEEGGGGGGGQADRSTAMWLPLLKEDKGYK